MTDDIAPVSGDKALEGVAAKRSLSFHLTSNFAPAALALDGALCHPVAAAPPHEIREIRGPFFHIDSDKRWVELS